MRNKKETMGKINNADFVPMLKKRKLFEGEAYYRICKPIHFFRKYQGVGFSTKLLDILDPLPIIICYKGKQKDEFYLTTVNKIKNSGKTWLNANCDLQKFVSFKDMERLL